MKTTTRKLLLDIATAFAIATTAAVAMAPAAALAAPMTANANSNVRASPGGPVIGLLQRGTTVDVLACGGGWCELEDGGFVSSRLLDDGRDVGVGISIGTDGVGISIGTSRPPIVIDDDDDDVRFAEACFFTRSNYRGDSFCIEEGDAVRRLDRRWNDEISSMRNPDGLRVSLCTERNFEDCRTYTTSARTLGRFSDSVSSIRVR